MRNESSKQAIGSILEDAAKQLEAVIQDEAIMAGTPVEVQCALGVAFEAIRTVLAGLQPAMPMNKPAVRPSAGEPTHQQGQFLAFIAEYMLRSRSGAAPSHAEFQRFFNLTPPSVNSMLIRLEQRGFIRRIPGKARAIELAIEPEKLPSLDRPFKF